MTIFIKKILMTCREFRAHDGPQGINPDILATGATGDWSMIFLAYRLIHIIRCGCFKHPRCRTSRIIRCGCSWNWMDPPYGPTTWCPKKCQSERHPAAHVFMAKILSFSRPLQGLPSTDTIWPSDTMWLSWCKKSHVTLVTDRITRVTQLEPMDFSGDVPWFLVLKPSMGMARTPRAGWIFENPKITWIIPPFDGSYVVNILLTMMVIIWLMMVKNNLVGGWATPLKNHGVC